MTSVDSLDVETTSGTFRGVRRGDGVRIPATRQWLGVPYAAPPIGRLRFRPPAPVVPKAGVRPADRYGTASSQAGSLTAPVRRLGDGVGEDCLYLNVHTPAGPPADAAGRPVLVWIHGGAFTGGSAALYDGSGLAALGDVVVVTVNYRLGALGFVDLAAVTDLDATSNNGLRDQIAALRWVRDNIAGFGGDPARVTVAGESAGSVAVSLLLCAPEARGLFRGAVMQSGSYSLSHGDEIRARVAQRYLRELGVAAHEGERLRTLSVGRLLEAQQAVDTAVAGTTPAAPWFDGDLVPASLAAAQQVTSPGVALLAGSNHDESELFRRLPGDILPVDRSTVSARLQAELGDPHARRVLDAYPVDRAGDRALTTDFDFAQPTRHFAERHAAAGGRTFVYRFDAGVPWWGATHAAELAYLWGWKGLSAWALRGPATAARLSLAARMQWSWVRFVHDLTPDPGWPAHTLSDRAVRVFDTRGDRVEHDPQRARRLAWAGAGRLAERVNTEHWGPLDDPRAPRALLVHGITSSAATTWELGEGLAAAGWDVTAVDLPGHGGSGPADSYRFADVADAIAAQCGTGFDLYVGHSLGGAIGTELLARHPDVAARAVLIDPALLVPDARADELPAQLLSNRAMTVEQVAAAYPHWHPRTVATRAQASADASLAAVQAFVDQNRPWDVRAAAAAVTVPVLVLVATEDSAVAPFLVDELPAANPRWRFETVPDSSHSIHRDHPQAVLGYLIG